MPLLALLGGGALRYVLIAVAAFGLLAWFHYSIVAPYQARIKDLNGQIEALNTAIAASAAIQEADTAQAARDRAAKLATDKQIEEIRRAATADSHACHFDDATLLRLRQLAGYKDIPGAGLDGKKMPAATGGSGASGTATPPR